MCGRYYVDDDTARAIERLVEQIDTKLARQQAFTSGTRSMNK